MTTILVVDDDAALARGLTEALTRESYAVKTAGTVQRARRMLHEEKIDLVLLDLILPDGSGEELCKEMHREGTPPPIIMLTSKKDEVDKIVGFEIGADDYVTKPFNVREQMARIKAVLRRMRDLPRDVPECSFGKVHVDFHRAEATRNGTPVRLLVRELEVLKFLVAHEGQVVTREMLLDKVWGYEEFPTTRTVDNYILSLRKKLEEKPSEPQHILTVYTAGYKFAR